jgi:carbon starvation protein
VGATPEAAAAAISSWGFPLTAESMAALAHSIGEATLFGRAGGAPTLALGMAKIFSSVLGGDALMGLWYHFAIMFEALFILTTVDAGTRVARFLVQAFLGQFWKPLAATHSWRANAAASALLVSAWGYFLYQGVIDPLGGIWTMWPLFGTSNQMLAAIALILCTVVLFKMKQQKVAWVTIVPAGWLVICTVMAGLEKIAHSNPAIGFVAHAWRFSDALADNKVLAPAKSIADMRRVIFNDYVDATLAALFVAVVLAMVVYGIMAIRTALASEQPTAVEVGDIAGALAAGPGGARA